MLIVSAVLFCEDCRAQRNKSNNDKTKQREYIVLWCKEVKWKVEKEEPSPVKLLVWRSKLDKDRSSTDNIKTWTHNSNELMCEVEKLPKVSVRRFF